MAKAISEMTPEEIEAENRRLLEKLFPNKKEAT